MSTFPLSEVNDAPLFTFMRQRSQFTVCQKHSENDAYLIWFSAIALFAKNMSGLYSQAVKHASVLCCMRMSRHYKLQISMRDWLTLETADGCFWLIRVHESCSPMSTHRSASGWPLRPTSGRDTMTSGGWRHTHWSRDHARRLIAEFYPARDSAIAARFRFRTNSRVLSLHFDNLYFTKQTLVNKKIKQKTTI